MSKITGSGLSRGDRRRNERLARLRAVVRTDLAVVAVDLAKAKQAVAVMDHDSRVLARREDPKTVGGLESPSTTEDDRPLIHVCSLLPRAAAGRAPRARAAPLGSTASSERAAEPVQPGIDRTR